MGSFRDVQKSPLCSGRRSGSARRVKTLGMFYRRHLRVGEKRGLCVGKTKRGKGTKIMAVADRSGLPVACCVASASPHETTLVDATIEQRFLKAKPQRLIGDKAYDSDGLDEVMRSKGIEMIAPNRSNRKNQTQDGRPLRRYVRRWKVERLFAWLGNYRRILTRHDYHVENYLGFVQLGCILILIRHL